MASATVPKCGSVAERHVSEPGPVQRRSHDGMLRHHEHAAPSDDDAEHPETPAALHWSRCRIKSPTVASLWNQMG
jgi:hypothetical protein